MKISSPFFLVAITGIMFGACKKEDGPAGKNSLINQVAEPAGVNCAVGGVKIVSGIDANSNNVLDSNEIQKTDFVCNANGIYNKETIINFPIPSSPYLAIELTDEMESLSAIDFNIANYPADSVAFSAYISSYDGLATTSVELYDQTNNKVIANSILTTQSKEGVLKSTTVNFLKDLPKGPVKLNFGLRTNNQMAGGYLYSAALKIYKK
ncbi:hypothetical protein A4H97_16520 [Niastella yeongjuensis]|uniref:DUF7151 domain-containing protein n=1 Tax=Niastella yeongjuensis TaxID=354355 RepID=A0A1V9E1Q4_9BACT|nr:hypothetical protein [Niastella yeongjuensis]OQP39825.1 hypothetical protein A4H97_16520 [Niastella yeongjuensis]SEO06782.1 hypothetical protein SAMN05660816_02051 [Niastella yeongjuensis]